MTTYEDAIRASMAKGAEAAKASAANRERDINGNGMYWYGKALEYKQMHEMAVRREQHLEQGLARAKKALAWMDERATNSTSHGSHCHAYEVAARKLREALS